MPSATGASPGRQYRRVQFDLRPEQFAQLRATAEAHGLPTSGLMRHLVDEFLSNYRGVLTLPRTSSQEAV
jgi:hypothetical protein